MLHGLLRGPAFAGCICCISIAPFTQAGFAAAHTHAESVEGLHKLPLRFMVYKLHWSSSFFECKSVPMHSLHVLWNIWHYTIACLPLSPIHSDGSHRWGLNIIYCLINISYITMHKTCTLLLKVHLSNLINASESDLEFALAMCLFHTISITPHGRI